MWLTLASFGIRNWKIIAPLVGALFVVLSVLAFGEIKERQGREDERAAQEERIRNTEESINEALRDPRTRDDALRRLRDFLRQ